MFSPGRVAQSREAARENSPARKRWGVRFHVHNSPEGAAASEAPPPLVVLFVKLMTRACAWLAPGATGLTPLRGGIHSFTSSYAAATVPRTY